MNTKDLKLLGILGRKAGMPQHKINELETSRKKKNMRDLHKRINIFRPVIILWD
jgi:hypothetical protein